VAAIADFIIAGRVFIPCLFGIGIYSYPVGLVGSVGISWGILLLYADRKPVERKWVLIPTILVIFLITIVYVQATFTNILSFPSGVIASVFGLIIFTFSIYSYRVNKIT